MTTPQEAARIAHVQRVLNVEAHAIEAEARWSPDRAVIEAWSRWLPSRFHSVRCNEMAPCSGCCPRSVWKLLQWRRATGQEPAIHYDRKTARMVVKFNTQPISAAEWYGTLDKRRW